MLLPRMFDKTPLPDIEAMRKFIASPPAVKAFDQCRQFLSTYYADFEPEISFGGKNYGVLIRYRRKGKTLLSIFPEKNAFSVVLVYGKKEAEAFEEERRNLTSYFGEIFDETHSYHDGRWLLLTFKDMSLLSDLEKMIAIKRKPKNL